MTYRPFVRIFQALAPAASDTRDVGLCPSAVRVGVVPKITVPAHSPCEVKRTPRRWERAGLATMLLGVALVQVGINKSHANSGSRPAQQMAATADAMRVDPGRPAKPALGSAAFIVASQTTGETLIEHGADAAMPIASITKLMTAMVVLDARQSLSEQLTVTADDIDRLKGTGSRLGLGTRLTREEMLSLALMSSENRAASALARHYPGGAKAFIDAMNIKASMIGLRDTRFADSTGLDPRNVSSAHDLVQLVSAASTYPLIREFSTASERHVRVGNRSERFGNSNALVRDPEWQVGVSKTGYIREAGRCLVMQTWVRDEPVIIVLLNSEGRYTRTADAKRVKQWLETAGMPRVAAMSAHRNGS